MPIWKLLRAAVAVTMALAITMPAEPARSAPQPLIWCAAELVTDTETVSNPTLSAYQRARHELCAGQAQAAVEGFAAIAPAIAKSYQNDGTHGIDFDRAYFYALLAAGDDDAARRLLTQFEGDWKPAAEEREFWSGQYAASFAGYVADDSNVFRTPDMAGEHKLDPHLNYALADLRAGKLQDAIQEKLADADEGSLYALMLGNLYAQQRNWPEAFAAWIEAAADGPGAAMMEFYTLDRWNVSALEMLYYYRAHAPARAPSPTVFCGSPTDLATVEALALKLPQAGGLDATSIMDAAIAGSVYARVDLQTKGRYTAYFTLTGGAWEPGAQPNGIAFPTGCANPHFVNRPSGP
jgi:hypothetical protein